MFICVFYLHRDTNKTINVYHFMNVDNARAHYSQVTYRSEVGLPNKMRNISLRLRKFDYFLFKAFDSRFSHLLKEKIDENRMLWKKRKTCFVEKFF